MTPPLAMVLFVAGCVSVTVDGDEAPGRLGARDGPMVEFDPQSGVFPLPNDLLLNADRQVQLPGPCDETSGARRRREQVLNTLDGFGTTHTALAISFTERPDFASVVPRVQVFASAQGWVDGADFDAVAVEVVASERVRFNTDCSTSELMSVVEAIPVKPLPGDAAVIVALEAGATTAGGATFLPSPTWALVRRSENPVTVVDGEVVAHQTAWDPFDDEQGAALLALDTLWRRQAPVLSAFDKTLGLPREEHLVAFGFTTQSVLGPLDPLLFASPAAKVPNAPLTALNTLLVDVGSGDPITAAEFLQTVLDVDAQTCTDLGCDEVGDILAGTLTAPSYQQKSPNPWVGGDPIPGAFVHPVLPEKKDDTTIGVVAVLPKMDSPTEGFPTVIFGHGLHRSKEDVYAIGPALAARGMAVAAIDWVGHGDRAVRTSDDPQDTGVSGLGCEGELDFLATGDHAHCFATFLSADLAIARDNLRQSALDLMALRAALAACGSSGCEALRVDPDGFGFVGHSIGSLVGALGVASDPKFAALVLNTGGAGLVEIITATEKLALKCPVVNALVADGTLLGEPFDFTAGTGACLDNGWVSQAGWQAYAPVARWILDPADPANFAAKLAPRPLLIQQVGADAVIPNATTQRLAQLCGLANTSRHADIAYTASPSPSRAVAAGAAWVIYKDVPATPGFVGNSFAHGSLLGPPADCQEPVGCGDGLLAVARMQSDAAAFLARHLGVE